jgi:hypothetical protein
MDTFKTAHPEGVDWRVACEKAVSLAFTRRTRGKCSTAGRLTSPHSSPPLAHLLSCPIHRLSSALPHASFGANEMSAYLRTPISARAQTGPTRTHFPLTRHFFSASSSDASSRAATARSTPTTTSALFVRRLRSGNAPASGPARAWSAGARDGGANAGGAPSAVANGVCAGQRTSPVSLRKLRQ